MREIWKDIQGYEGIYQISNLGNIKSISYQGFKREHLMKPKSHHTGYKIVMLCKNGVQKNKSIHTLVAEAFIKNPENKPYVNHIDGNKQNNVVSNLEWVTAKENTHHAIENNLFNPLPFRFNTGKNHHMAKPVLQYTKDGLLVKRWDCISDAARYLNCNPSMIVNNASERTKSCKGYIFKYEDK